jgi:hypothetical protein
MNGLKNLNCDTLNVTGNINTGTFENSNGSYYIGVNSNIQNQLNAFNTSTTSLSGTISTYGSGINNLNLYAYSLSGRIQQNNIIYGGITNTLINSINSISGSLNSNSSTLIKNINNSYDTLFLMNNSNNYISGLYNGVTNFTISGAIEYTFKENRTLIGLAVHSYIPSSTDINCYLYKKLETTSGTIFVEKIIAALPVPNKLFTSTNFIVSGIVGTYLLSPICI